MLKNLSARILSAFILVILILGVLILGIGYYFINKNIIDEAQQQVKKYLHASHIFYHSQIDSLGKAFLLSQDENQLKETLDLDYIQTIDRNDFTKIKSEIVKKAVRLSKGMGGTRTIGVAELKAIREDLSTRVFMPILPTHKALPTKKKAIQEALAIEYAFPYQDKVIYGGKIINRNFKLIKEIDDIVFEKRTYQKKPIGTVTIFQGDVRIATNVLNAKNKPAVGTRVSEVVNNKVLKEGQIFLNRAFVVTDWYLTAYEPIYNISGGIIGMLYVGVLEKPFLELRFNSLLTLSAIIFLALLLAIFLSVILANSIAKPVTNLLKASQAISAGRLDQEVEDNTSIKELNLLAESFNQMTQSLARHTQKLKQLNKNYLDLIGFVTHELKGILSSTLLNTYMVRDGYLGNINFKQRKSLDSIVRSLEYFTGTIKNFFNLSRIEKGEINFETKALLLNEDIILPSMADFKHALEEKKTIISNLINPELTVKGDLSLLKMLLNNLLGNAIKYGKVGGEIKISAELDASMVTVAVYNQGRPLKEKEIKKLFRKFSRLDSAETKKEKGTGLGLFIVKEIIEKHRGKIWIEPQKDGNTFKFTLERGSR